jgi:hypothetical protein
MRTGVTRFTADISSPTSHAIFGWGPRSDWSLSAKSCRFHPTSKTGRVRLVPRGLGSWDCPQFS